jgi:hypothetical protein
VVGWQFGDRSVEFLGGTEMGEFLFVEERILVMMAHVFDDGVPFLQERFQQRALSEHTVG